MTEMRQDYRHFAAWMLAFGCLSLALGVLAVLYSVLFTFVSVFFLAGILIAAGIVESFHAIRHRDRGHLVFYILEALLAIVVGFLLLRSPAAGALVITLLLASYFVIVGIFRIVAALTLRFLNWGWTLADGIITTALGIIVWGGWPVTGFWVLGLFIGVHLILRGWARIMFAVALRTHHFGALEA